MTTKTMKQYKEHHTSWARGYISRKPNSDGTYGYREPYNGKFGKGYIEHKPSLTSTQYHLITYYIETEE